MPEHGEQRDEIHVHDAFWGIYNEIFVNATKVFWKKVWSFLYPLLHLSLSFPGTLHILRLLMEIVLSICVE